jgi:hypothetical protein
MNKKAVIIIIVIVVIILLAVSSWLVYKKLIKKDKKDEDTDGDYNLPPINYSGGAPSGGYTTPISFPIKKGMNGAEVVDIQNAINKKCNKSLNPDGKFGPGTQAALQSCYNVSEVDQTLYTTMKISGSAAPWVIPTCGTGTQLDIYFVAENGVATRKYRCVAKKTPVVGEVAIGKLAYPKGTYSNVRDSAKVSSFNLLGKVNSPNVVGKITNVTFGAETPTPYRWYQVSLLTPLMMAGRQSPSLSTTGWVREDTVKIS